MKANAFTITTPKVQGFCERCYFGIHSLVFHKFICANVGNYYKKGVRKGLPKTCSEVKKCRFFQGK